MMFVGRRPGTIRSARRGSHGRSSATTASVRLAVVVAAIQLAFATAPVRSALGAAPSEGEMVVVGYVDVARKRAADARSLLEALVSRTGQDTASTQALLLQNEERPTEFVEVSVWTNTAASTRFADQPATRQARARLLPMQTAPFDERQVIPMDGGMQPLPKVSSAIYVVTHIDIIPQKIAEGTDALKKFASSSKRQHGCVEIEILRQASRQNHFTLLEIWADPDAFEAHLQSDAARSFRQRVLTMSGSLYDQRQFRLIAVGSEQGAGR